MSPNLLAFNMFASEMRLVLRDSTLLSRAEMQMGIEKVIGNRWKAMTAEEKEKHIDKARVEQARLIAEGGIPQQSGSGRSKKQKANAASDPVPKRRRGRPPKTTGVSQRKSSPTNRQGNAFAPGGGFNSFLDVHDEHQSHHHHHHHDSHQDRDPFGYNDHHNLSDLFMPFNSSSMPVVTNSKYDHHKQRHDDPMSFLQHDVVNVMDQDGLKPTQPPSGADLTGMRVEGFIDGAFDTGYFMTVRVNGQTLRGMLYREDACMRAVGQHAHAQATSLDHPSDTA